MKTLDETEKNVLYKAKVYSAKRQRAFRRTLAVGGSALCVCAMLASAVLIEKNDERKKQEEQTQMLADAQYNIGFTPYESLGNMPMPESINEMNQEKDGDSNTEQGKKVNDAESGDYIVAVDWDADFYGGEYLDESGKIVVWLVGNSEETQKMYFEMNPSAKDKDIIFKEAKYSHKYLDELQKKISDAMTNKELPFVFVSSIMDSENCIFVKVGEINDEKLEKLYSFDTVGGAIKIMHSEEMPKIDVLYEK